MTRPFTPAEVAAVMVRPCAFITDTKTGETITLPFAGSSNACFFTEAAPEPEQAIPLVDLLRERTVATDPILAAIVKWRRA